MRLEVDREADALYLRLAEARIVESEEVQPGVILDFDIEGQVVGIEVLDLAKRVPIEMLESVTIQIAGDGAKETKGR